MNNEAIEFIDTCAMLAMQALVAKHRPFVVEGEMDDFLPGEIAHGAYEYAEAMLAERMDRIAFIEQEEEDLLNEDLLNAQEEDRCLG